MDKTRIKEMEQKLEALTKDKEWKGHITVGILFLLVYGLLISPFFAGIKWLADTVFLLAGVGFILYGIFEYLEKK